MGPVSIGVEEQRNTDGDTPSTLPGAEHASLKIYVKACVCVTVGLRFLGEEGIVGFTVCLDRGGVQTQMGN